MAHLRYRVHDEASVWRWEVLAPDDRIVASGTRKSEHEARADALRASMHLASRDADARVAK
jgi:hypothetical protein